MKTVIIKYPEILSYNHKIRYWDPKWKAAILWNILNSLRSNCKAKTVVIPRTPWYCSKVTLAEFALFRLRKYDSEYKCYKQWEGK